MNKKLVAFSVVLLNMFNLVGCQLAKEDKLATDNENLSGVFVTYELEDAGESDEELLDENKKYYGIIDNTIDLQKHKFAELSGYTFLLNERGQGENRYKESLQDDIFQNVKLDVHVTSDDKNSEEVNSTENKISGTIYVTSKFKGIMKFNPIIQDNDKFYTVLQGNNLYIDGSNEGTTSTSASSDSTSTFGDKSSNEKFSYSINVESVDELEKIKIKEINKDDKVIRVKEIVHHKDEYIYKIDEKTDYIIVEEECLNKDNKEIKNRIIYDVGDIEQDDVNHLCNYSNKDGIVEPKILIIKK